MVGIISQCHFIKNKPFAQETVRLNWNPGTDNQGLISASRVHHCWGRIVVLNPARVENSTSTNINVAPLINSGSESMTGYVLSNWIKMWTSHKVTDKNPQNYLVSTALWNTPTRSSPVWSQFAEHKILEMYLPHPCFELCRRIFYSYRSLGKFTISVKMANLHKNEGKLCVLPQRGILPSLYSLCLHFSNCPSRICFHMVNILLRSWKYKQGNGQFEFLSEPQKQELQF